MAKQIPFIGSLRYLNEYLFCTLIGLANRDLSAERRLTAQDGRGLRERLDALLALRAPDGSRLDVPASKPLTMATARGAVPAGQPAPLLEALRELFAEFPGAREALDGAAGRKLAQDVLERFRDATGYQRENGSALPDAMLPLSPFAPECAYHETFLDNGTRLLWAHGDDIAEALSSLPTGAGGAPPVLSNATWSAVFTDTLPLYRQDPETEEFEEAGFFLTDADRSGLSALRPWISREEYAELTAEVDGRPWISGAGKYMSAATIERVRRLVEKLRMEGEEFRAVRDRRSGQACADFGGGLQLRLIDPYHEEYAGTRVFWNGIIVTMYTIGKNHRAEPYVPGDAAQCLDMLHYVMGHSVKQWEPREPGKRIRPIGTVQSFNGKHISRHELSSLTNRGYSAYCGMAEVDGARRPVYISFQMKLKSMRSFFKFSSKDEAERFLRESVVSARERVSALLDAEGLIETARTRIAEAETPPPALCPDPGIAAIQQSYWDVLTGERSTLVRPGFDSESYFASGHTPGSEEFTYPRKTPEELVRAHAADTLDALIGSFEPETRDGPDKGKRFHPANVLRFMRSDFSDKLTGVVLADAMRVGGVRADELRGAPEEVNWYRERLLRFDPATACPMKGHLDPFISRMYRVIADAVEENACLVPTTVNPKTGRHTADTDAILINANGIVRYTVTRICKMADTAAARVSVTGELGQLLAPDENGAVHITGTGEGYYLIPGYASHVLPDRPGERTPYERRVVLRGYEQTLREAIRRQLRLDLLQYVHDAGSPVSLNDTIRALCETRYPENVYRRTEQDGVSAELRRSVIATERARVKFPKSLVEGSSRVMLYRAGQRTEEASDGNFFDAMTLTGRRNPAVPEPSGDGIFDPYFTDNTVSGGVRYLVRGASVDRETGRVIPSPDESARAPLIEYLRDSGRFPDFDAADRLNMTANGLREALRETPRVGLAQLSFGALTLEDGIVISRRFAESNPVPDLRGEYRPLMPGDKLECHGNKGVISAVVDPEASPETLEKHGLTRAAEWFRANPRLDVVMSPYSAVSRFNAGLAAEAMASEPADLVSPDGELLKGCLGFVKLSILKQTADTKTRFSEDTDGLRTYGAQMVWALAANDCTKLLKDSFRGNAKAVLALREQLLVMGLDLDPTGRLLIGYTPHPGERRRVFGMKALSLRETKYGPVPRFSAMCADLGMELSWRGGFLELPFPLRFPVEDAGLLPETPEERRTGESHAVWPGKRWLLPVMAPFVRTGMELRSGEAILHDYTNAYLEIYEASLRYLAAGEGEDADTERNDLASEAQRAFDSITHDLETRVFQGKNNVFRRALMSCVQARSCTAIWTPDPSLRVDEAGMNPEMMQALGLREGDSVLVHRDPVLQSSGIRCMRVRTDARLVGISVHPAGIPGGMDGDFDGDTVGVHVAGRRAMEEAAEKLSVQANLLDRSRFDPETGNYRLFIAAGQDIAAGHAARPALGKRRAALETQINRFEQAFREGRITRSEVRKRREHALREIDAYLRDCAEAGFARHIISYAGPEQHIRSVEAYVDDGAKGNREKLDTYARFLGLRFRRGPDGAILPGSVEAAEHSLADREEQTGILKAKNMQTEYTGIAGQFAIRAMRSLLNVCPDAATRVNKLPTQGGCNASTIPEWRTGLRRS